MKPWRRTGGIGPAAPPLPAPVATMDLVAPQLEWTWGGTNPTDWRVEFSVAPFPYTWVEFFTLAGANRGLNTTVAASYRLVGVTGGVTVTSYSNIVVYPP